ncbi:thioesterase family protein [Nocardioides sp. zg-536]|uniref:Thioesterase family protein n=1 Tax=Nocardioides faecalis TaxID=2803858 RepID=A0A938Y286_9ACTN|nr:thioesterase family protein [Nocardioides faecalis]MBM9458613.1 thioesterase family protein [Nocardioides faecalis]MBS4752945.1 thioesterase family protein [Nocardioides faecalis]QVI58612.1 thioesterase family protein [Nocardioides faecalis]
MSAQPSYQQLVDLPAWAVQPVPMAFEDSNGFLNVRHYLGIGSEGLDESLVDVGILPNWPRSEGLACLSAEHHVTYFHELRTGDQLSVRVLLLGRAERAAHALVYVLDGTRERLACTFEEIFLCVDVAERRAVPWPEDVATRLDARIAEHAALGWQPVTSGSLSLR